MPARRRRVLDALLLERDHRPKPTGIFSALPLAGDDIQVMPAMAKPAPRAGLFCNASGVTTAINRL
jgi:hypothetical protein